MVSKESNLQTRQSQLDYVEMEMKKLHMGTMSFGSDSMDEISHQLAVAFEVSGEAAHHRQGSLATGAQLAVRGRRDMSSRVKDVVLSLALCHNVSQVSTIFQRRSSLYDRSHQ